MIEHYVKFWSMYELRFILALPITEFFLLLLIMGFNFSANGLLKSFK